MRREDRWCQGCGENPVHVAAKERARIRRRQAKAIGEMRALATYPSSFGRSIGLASVLDRATKPTKAKREKGPR